MQKNNSKNTPKLKIAVLNKSLLIDYVKLMNNTSSGGGAAFTIISDGISIS